MIQQFAKHHNKIQFFGYEVANLLLVSQQFWAADNHAYGLNAETLGALGLLLGSALIWFFNPKTRPYLLFYGGIALAIGGAFFAAAGYLLTGISVALASLETARGGLGVLNGVVGEQTELPRAIRFHQRLAAWSLGWYCQLVDVVAGYYPRLGRFIDERPFITSTLIKAPLRFEFIIKKLIVGDWIGVFVGLSWLFLGDLALAFNDDKLRQAASQPAKRLRQAV